MRGTVVHKVLEDLFDLPAAERTHDRASLMLGPVWESLLVERARAGRDVRRRRRPGEARRRAVRPGDLADQCRDLLERYFALEDPQRLEPAEREVHVETLLDVRAALHGYVDRLDVAPTGEMRIVDYKTGRVARASTSRPRRCSR